MRKSRSAGTSARGCLVAVAMIVLQGSDRVEDVPAIIPSRRAEDARGHEPLEFAPGHERGEAVVAGRAIPRDLRPIDINMRYPEFGELPADLRGGAASGQGLERLR